MGSIVLCMAKLIRDIDRLLRGGFTRAEDLRAGRIEVPVGRLVLAGLLLGVFYGGFMGLYAGLRPTNPDWRQTLATAIKVPWLFLMTLSVTYPSLYVTAALARSRLGAAEILRLLLVAITVNLALLASLGPVVGFFTLSTESYPFMVLLNVLFFSISGFVGLGFLRRAVLSVFDAPADHGRRVEPGEDRGRAGDSGEGDSGGGDSSEGSPADETAGEPRQGEAAFVEAPHARESLGTRELPSRELSMRERNEARELYATATSVLKVWVVLFAVVGGQMAWIMRPFIGTPDEPFSLNRERESNFFLAVLEAIRQLFSG